MRGCSCCGGSSSFLEQFEIILNVCKLLFHSAQAPLLFVDDAQRAKENVFLVRSVQLDSGAKFLRGEGREGGVQMRSRMQHKKPF